MDLGILAIVIGVILAVLGSAGRAVGGRRHWYWGTQPLAPAAAGGHNAQMVLRRAIKRCSNDTVEVPIAA